MPRVTRSRTLTVPPDSVWRVVADPHHLPRWWPRTMRVEDVTGRGKSMRWTSALQTERGNTVRADFRCVGSSEPKRFAWSQDIAGTPFERILRAADVEVLLEPAGGSTKVTIVNDESLKGLSRLGSQMMRGAAKRRLDDALDGLAQALVGDP